MLPVNQFEKLMEAAGEIIKLLKKIVLRLDSIMLKLGAVIEDPVEEPVVKLPHNAWVRPGKKAVPFEFWGYNVDEEGHPAHGLLAMAQMDEADQALNKLTEGQGVAVIYPSDDYALQIVKATGVVDWDAPYTCVMNADDVNNDRWPVRVYRKEMLTQEKPNV